MKKGDYITKPDQKKLMLSVPSDEKTTVRISESPNAVTVINGFDSSSNAKLDLLFSLDHMQIDEALLDQ